MFLKFRQLSLKNKSLKNITNETNKTNKELYQNIKKNNLLVYNSFSKLEKNIYDNKKQIFNNYKTDLDKSQFKLYKMDRHYDTFPKNKNLELMHVFFQDKKYVGPSKYTNLDLNMSVTNMLIYGKTILRNMNDVERILPYVKFAMVNEHEGVVFQIDNYIIKYGHFYETTKEYDISLADNTDNLDFVNNDNKKLFTAKYTIQLMNETNPKHLNFGNYIMLNKWYTINNMSIQKAHFVKMNHDLYSKLWKN